MAGAGTDFDCDDHSVVSGCRSALSVPLVVQFQHILSVPLCYVLARTAETSPVHADLVVMSDAPIPTEMPVDYMYV